MTPWVKRLLAANVVVFLVLNVALMASDPRTANLVMFILALTPRRVLVEPWSPFTYMFLHAGFLHLLFNMIVLFFFGPRLEAKLGGRHFLILYFVSGLTGALFSVFTPDALIVGASGAVLGVLYGFARYWPREKIYIWAILPVESRFLVIFLVFISLFFAVTGAEDGIAHFAHLGGLMGGFLFLRWRERNTAAVRFKKKLEAPRARIPGRELDRWRSVDRETLHPLNREEYDRIIGKAEERGAGSLTPVERSFLERFVQD